MSAALSDATATEQASIQSHEALMVAKKKEVAALQAQIEEEMTRVGNLGVELSQMTNDVEDTRQALSEDEQFKLQLEEGCSTKSKEWEEVKQNRAQELIALSETIKVLNDDDALDLFK